MKVEKSTTTLENCLVFYVIKHTSNSVTSPLYWEIFPQEKNENIFVKTQNSDRTYYFQVPMAHLSKLVISWVTFYSIVSGYSDIKLESNKQYIFKEFWVKDKITMEIRKYFEENNEDKT